MYDRVIVQYPLGEIYAGWSWVTHDFDEVYETYIITAEGQLIRDATAWEVTEDRREDPGRGEVHRQFPMLQAVPLGICYVQLDGRLTLVGHPPECYTTYHLLNLYFMDGLVTGVELVNPEEET